MNWAIYSLFLLLRLFYIGASDPGSVEGPEENRSFVEKGVLKRDEVYGFVNISNKQSH